MTVCMNLRIHQLDRGNSIVPRMFNKLLRNAFPQAAQKGSRCKAVRDGPSEAYMGYAAASAQAEQRSRWAFFSSL